MSNTYPIVTTPLDAPGGDSPPGSHGVVTAPGAITVHYGDDHHTPEQLRALADMSRKLSLFIASVQRAIPYLFGGM